jgi:hypothetical protein
VILIRGESRNTAGSNMGLEENIDSIGCRDMADVRAGFI